MKKVTKIIIAVIITIAISILSTVPVYCGNQYYRTGVITKVDYQANEWWVLDTTGNVWTFADGEDLLEQDIIIMIMDDRGTENITDDNITHVYYIGYYEG